MSTDTISTSTGAEVPEKWPRTLGEAQKVVDAMRFRLQSELQVNSPEMQELARSYAVLCRRCNDRLREAEALLKNGNPSQVIQACDVEPRLFPLVSIADLPERAEWMQLVVLYDLEEPEPVLMEIGEQLNDAYSHGASLETLLARHRLLALARAPLMERAKVLRLLCAADSASHHWTDDLRELEGAWLRDVEGQIQAAFARRDSGFLREVLGQLQSGELLEKPPERILKSAKARLDSLIQANSRKMLGSIADHLDEAFSALDRSRALQLRNQWMQYSVTAKLASDDPLMQRVSPVLAWLSDQDVQAAEEAAFDRAIKQLKQTIASPAATPEDLNAAVNRVAEQGHTVPTDVSAAWQVAMDVARGRIRRRLHLTIASVAAGILILGGIAYATISTIQKTQALTALVAEIQLLLDRDDLSAAAQRMPQLIGFSGSPERTQVERRFAEMMVTEKTRLQQYEAIISQASVPTLSTEQALELTQRAAAIARPGAEKERVASLDKDLKSKLASERLATDTEVRQICAGLEARMKSWEEPRFEAAEIDRLRSDLDAAEPEFSRLRQVSQRASGELKNLASATESRRKSLHNTLEKAAKRLALLKELDEKSWVDPMQPGVNPKTILDAWYEGWKRYSTAFPADALSRTPGLDGELQLWIAALELSRLLTDDEDWIPGEARQIEVRVKSIGERLDSFRDIPEGASLREYHDLLDSILHQHLGPDGNLASGARDKLRQLLSDPLIRDTYLIVANKQNYYVPSLGDVERFMETRSLTYVVGNSIRQTKNTFISKADLSDAELKSSKPVRSPQAVFAAKYLAQLEGKSVRDWLDVTEEMARSLIADPRSDSARNQSEASSVVIDPMQRYLLVRSTLQFAGEGHSLLRDEISPRLSVLDDPDLNLDALWMDPKNTSGNAARNRSESRLNQARSILEAWPAARKRQVSLQEATHGKLRAVGWLYRGGSSTWAIRTTGKPDPGASLEVLLPGGENSPARWVVIGPVGSKGELPGLATKAENFREGRLVFARSKGNPGTDAGK